MIPVINESKLFDLNEKFREMIDRYPEWETTANRRNQAHVRGVRTFAKKIGHDFPNHDQDKFTHLYVPYILISMGYNRDHKDDIAKEKKKNPEMDNFMRWASYSHVTNYNNAHHPEVYDIESVAAAEKDKEHEQIIDAAGMSDIAIIEMCCDWAAVGAEKGNSPQSWFKLKNQTKFKFTEHQQELIKKTLEELWPGGNDETEKIEHEERFFNDKIWEQLNKMWDDYNNSKSLEESYAPRYDFGEFENAIRILTQEKDNVKDVVGKLTQKDYEPKVKLPGVGSLQAISFLFSPTVTNYLVNLLDSVINQNYSEIGDSKTLKALNLDKIEFGQGYTTEKKITSNFVKGILNSLERVNQSKIKNKAMLVMKFINNLKKHAKTIKNSLEKEKYLEDVEALVNVLKVVKNIIVNRNSFANVLHKTLMLQESDEEVVSNTFINIYEGI